MVGEHRVVSNIDTVQHQKHKVSEEKKTINIKKVLNTCCVLLKNIVLIGIDFIKSKISGHITGGKKVLVVFFLQTHKNREGLPPSPNFIFIVPLVVFNLPIVHTIWDTLYVKTIA